MAVRQGDPLTTGHGCTSVTTLSVSLVQNVKSNGIANAVVGTPTVGHTIGTPPFCVGHASILKQGSSTVKCGGIPWGRVADSADAGAMISGSMNVLVNGR